MQLEEWATMGGALVANGKIDYLLKCIIPLILVHCDIAPDHSVWDAVPS